MKTSRTIASRKVPKVTNRKLGTNEGVDVKLTASVAVGYHTCGLDPDKDAPRLYDRIDQEIHVVTTGLFYHTKKLPHLPGDLGEKIIQK